MYVDKHTGQYSFVPLPEKFPKDGDLWDKFRKFHTQHPEVYEHFKVHLPLSIEGKKLVTSYEVREVMVSYDKIKPDNNLAPYYLRTFIEEFPQYEDFFIWRAVRNER